VEADPVATTARGAVAATALSRIDAACNSFLEGGAPGRSSARASELSAACRSQGSHYLFIGSSKHESYTLQISDACKELNVA
jgi:hypothetical protein